MTKKVLSVLTMMSIAVMMMLSSCTAAGVECGLIGTWEYSKDKVTITIEITADDKIIYTGKYDGKTNVEFESTIKSVENHEIICDVVEDLKYSDLGCDTVKFKVNGRYETFKKVN